MRKDVLKYIFAFLLILSMAIICGCNKNKTEISTSDNVSDSSEEPVIVIDDSDSNNINLSLDDYIAEKTKEKNAFGSVAIASSIAEQNNDVEDSEEENTIPGEKQDYTIVWIGDSLTQGSLGEANDNLPNAPYVKLAEITGNKVQGFGYYGYNTHDIFWFFSDEDHDNQRKNPAKVYVFWCGSNDWVVNGVPNSDAKPVISQIDSFISSGGIDKYIVMGTTQRLELRGSSDDFNMYDMINSQLKEHYGEHYFDVTDIISIKEGYGPDRIHLTQESYDLVATKLAEKLNRMNYL